MTVQSRFLDLHVLQLTSVDEVERNVETILRLLETLPSRENGQDVCQKQLVCLPENCLYMRVEEGEVISPLDLRSRYWNELVNAAIHHNAVLHFGSVPCQGQNKLTNSSVVVDGSAPRVVYSKIHLFDIDVIGHKPVRESDVFENGSEPRVLDVSDWKIGQSICYDLRFAELYSVYARTPVDIILVPSAFLVPTGEAHWHSLLRARAIESQCYVVAAAQSGLHQGRNGGKRSTYGHSLIVDPWGRVLADGGQGVQVISRRLDRDVIASVRRQIPMAAHRRL